MQKMKKGLAATLAVTMVMGSSFTAFAAESGSTTGNGTSEGHVDTHVINVELPTVADGATPFAYTMDAERLIQETGGSKYTDAVFPEESADTGVYFLTGTNEDGKNVYANSSEELKVVSKSSADVNLTVEVEASEAATDIALVDSAPGSDVSDAQLYLALKVGSSETAIKSGEKVSKEVTIQGKDENFVTTVKDGNYVYAEKEVGAGEDPLTWNEESISLTGAVSKASAEGLTAPTLTVTWKYTDPAETAAPSATEGEYTVTQGTPVVIGIDMGKGAAAATSIKSVSFVKPDGTTNVIAEGKYTFENGQLTLPLAATDSIITLGLDSREFTITFDNDAVVQVNLVPAEG